MDGNGVYFEAMIQISSLLTFFFLPFIFIIGIICGYKTDIGMIYIVWRAGVSV